MGKNNSKKNDNGNEKSIEDKSGAKRELKFSPQSTQGKSKFASYSLVREHLINSIQQKLDKGVNVADAIMDGKLIDWDDEAPELQISESTDPVTYKKETKKFETMYEKNVD